MAFHNIHAYFTGYKYEPDPDLQQQAEMPVSGGDPQSIVEMIVREKVGQEPEEQSATAEGDTTFMDLIERQEEEAVAGPEPMPSVLDAAPVDAPGESTDLPAERIVENVPEPAMGPPPNEGAVPDGLGATDMADATVTDRLGLDGLFAIPETSETPEAPDASEAPEIPGAWDGMFGGPGYDDIVDQAIGYGGEEADEYEGEYEGEYEEDEGEALEGVEDLLPDEDEVLGEPEPIVSGDRGFLKSVLRAPERRAAIFARRLAGVTINIGIDGTDEDVAVGLTGGSLSEQENGASEGTDFDFEAEATAAARRVLASSDVIINIDIGGGPDEPDLEGFGELPEGEPEEGEEWPEEGEEESGVGEAPMSDEELIEGLETEGLETEGLETEGLETKPDKGQSKQDAMEAFDELDDLGDVFESGGDGSGEPGKADGESDEYDETGQLGI